jgi:hypothetical protein
MTVEIRNVREQLTLCTDSYNVSQANKLHKQAILYLFSSRYAGYPDK